MPFVPPAQIVQVSNVDDLHENDYNYDDKMMISNKWMGDKGLHASTQVGLYWWCWYLHDNDYTDDDDAANTYLLMMVI